VKFYEARYDAFVTAFTECIAIRMLLITPAGKTNNTTGNKQAFGKEAVENNQNTKIA
jgi:hypothetical protein